MPTAFRIDEAWRSAARTVRRVDRGDLRPAHNDARGYLFAEGRAARPGIYLYRNRDGSTRRELIPDDVLFDPDSLASLGHAPVTLGHNGPRVTPATYKDRSVGHVGGKIRVQGRFVEVEVAIMRDDAIRAVKGRRAVELSPEYTAEVADVAGVHPTYGEFDSVQLRRTYDALSIVPAARGGHDVRLNVDADSDPDFPYAVQSDTFRFDAPFGGSGMNVATLLALLAPIGVTAADDEDTIRTKVSAAKAKADSADGKVDPPDPAQVVKDRNAYADRRAKLLDGAAKAGLKFDGVDLSGVSNDDLTAKIVRHFDSDVAADEDPTYLRARFDGWYSEAATEGSIGRDAYRDARGPTGPAPKQRSDAKDDPNAWRRPPMARRDGDQVVPLRPTGDAFKRAADAARTAADQG